MKRSHQKFYTKLSATATARKNCGVYLYDGFLSPVEARDAFVLMGDDAEFPWDKNPDLDGERLDRHAYKHDRKKFSRDRKKKKQFEGLSRLEAICSKIERDFGMKVSYVCCNRFEDPDHRIDWHVDTFGEHICVLSLGSKRRIEFRNYETGEIDAVTPAAGDLYVMPLQINQTHDHRVCAAIETDAVAGRHISRLSFVFVFEMPWYSTEFCSRYRGKTSCYGIARNFER